MLLILYMCKLTLFIVSSHYDIQMATIIFAAGHRLVYRAPYHPIDGPIEFVFNTVQAFLVINMHRVRNNAATLVQITNLAIASIPTFIPYFSNCGYYRV